ncbi:MULTISPECIES: hypothetical protein [unclassified Geodermatophilus]
MAIVWITDEDRQDMHHAAEERRVPAELEQKYAVYREADRTPLTEGRLRILNGQLDLSPSRRGRRRRTEKVDGKVTDE